MMIAVAAAIYLLAGIYLATWADYRDSLGGGDEPLGPANPAECCAYVLMWPAVGFSLAVVLWAYRRGMR